MTDPIVRIAERLLEDVLTSVAPEYWRRRAAILEDARPRPGDFNGRATRADLAARDARLAADAERCRQHAELITGVRPWWLGPILAEGVL